MIALPKDDKMFSVSYHGEIIETTLSSEIDEDPELPYENKRSGILNMKQIRKNIICVTDTTSTLNIYCTEPNLVKLCELKTENNYQDVRGLACSYSTIVTGELDGTINIFECHPEREKYTKQVATIQAKQGIREICIRQTPRREIIVADQLGVVSVFDFISKQPVYVLQGHTDVITQMHWDDDAQVL